MTPAPLGMWYNDLYDDYDKHDERTGGQYNYEMRCLGQ